jgi:hypothetical protein
LRIQTRIRIRIQINVFFGPPGSRIQIRIRILLSLSKNSKKNLDFHNFTADVYDTGGNFAAGVVDIGVKFTTGDTRGLPPVSLIPAAILPPV